MEAGLAGEDLNFFTVFVVFCAGDPARRQLKVYSSVYLTTVAIAFTRDSHVPT